MAKASRRNFLKKAGLTLGATALAGYITANPSGNTDELLDSFGFQVWTIRKELIQNFAGTLKMMAAMGYKEVEMCSPPGYSNAGFEPLNKMSGTEMKSIIDDAGLVCHSSHFNMGELRDHLDNRIERSKQMGITQMINASLWLPEDASLDDYREAANELNAIGEKTRAEGIQTGYHNHNMEFEKRDGKLIYDALLEEFDPDLVKMSFRLL